jgi:hypothetical protein
VRAGPGPKTEAARQEAARDGGGKRKADEEAATGAKAKRQRMNVTADVPDPELAPAKTKKTWKSKGKGKSKERIDSSPETSPDMPLPRTAMPTVTPAPGVKLEQSEAFNFDFTSKVSHDTIACLRYADEP